MRSTKLLLVLVLSVSTLWAARNSPATGRDFTPFVIVDSLFTNDAVTPDTGQAIPVTGDLQNIGVRVVSDDTTGTAVAGKIIFEEGLDVGGGLSRIQWWKSNALIVDNVTDSIPQTSGDLTSVNSIEGVSLRIHGARYLRAIYIPTTGNTGDVVTVIKWVFTPKRK